MKTSLRVLLVYMSVVVVGVVLGSVFIQMYIIISGLASSSPAATAVQRIVNQYYSFFAATIAVVVGVGILLISSAIIDIIKERRGG